MSNYISKITVADTEYSVKDAEARSAVTDIDETASQALNTLNASCGFDSNGVYTPSHELLEGATNLRFALDILAAYVEKLEERIATLEESA